MFAIDGMSYLFSPPVWSRLKCLNLSLISFRLTIWVVQLNSAYAQIKQDKKNIVSFPQISESI